MGIESRDEASVGSLWSSLPETFVERKTFVERMLNASISIINLYAM